MIPKKYPAIELVGKLATADRVLKTRGGQALAAGTQVEITGCVGGIGGITVQTGVCPECGQIEYPKICPAVIVAVTHGDKLLLTRYANRPFQNYALIAGFVEIGETLEDTVHREVMEEVGVKVKNLRYYKNQPWAFTDTLLTGFYCELDGDPAITLDHNELCEGVWLSREEIPSRENDISLTAEMIERFRLGLA